MRRQTNFDPPWARQGSADVVVADSARARILRRSGQRLAAQLAARLTRQARTDRRARRVLIAEPPFLGLLPAELESVRVIRRELARRLTCAMSQAIAPAPFPTPGVASGY